MFKPPLPGTTSGALWELLDRYRPVANAATGKPKSDVDLRGWEWRYFWKLARGDEHFKFSQYSDLIGSVAFSPDGRHLILRGEREGVLTWDFNARKPIARTPATGSARSIAVSPIGTLAAFNDVAKDGSSVARFWDYSAGRDIAVLPLPAAATWFAFSPDGKELAILTSDGSIHVCDVASRRFLAQLPIQDVAMRGSAPTLQFAPDGRWLAISQRGRVLL